MGFAMGNSPSSWVQFAGGSPDPFLNCFNRATNVWSRLPNNIYTD
jgi:hypothetical protein